MSNKQWNTLVRVVEVVIVVALVLGLLYACTYAWDNDPMFQLSPAYTGSVR